MLIHFKRSRYLLTAVIIALVLYSCNQEVSVTPPDKLPPDGYILIESNPNGANIYLNGKDTRRITPDSLSYLSTGTYNFTLKKDLFRDTTFTYDIVEGEKKSTVIDYTKNPLMLGQINCDSSPEGAEIFLNDSATGKVTPVTLKQIVPGFYNVKYHLMNFEDNLENVVVQSNKTSASRLTLIDTTTWKVFNTSNSPLKTDKLTCVAVDKNNNIWIGTEDQGLWEYNGVTWQQTMPFDHLPDNLPDTRVSVITVENNGDVWVGTKYGVLIITSTGFERYNAVLGPKPFIDPSIKDIKTKTPDVYIVTDSTFVIETNPSGFSRLWSTENGSYYATYGHFTSVGLDNNNNFWLGTVNRGIFMYSKTFPTKIFYNTSNTREIGDSVTAIAVSKTTGTVWIGYKWSVVAGSGLSYYANGFLKAPSVIPFNQNTNSIYIDDNNRKWIGTTSGLIVFDDVSSTTIYDKETTGLNINDVRGVAKDQQGRVWIATYGGGLFLKKK